MLEAKTLPKIAVVTTFAREHFAYARYCLESFKRYWPEEVQLLIQLSPDCEDILPDIVSVSPKTAAINMNIDRDWEEWLGKHKDYDSGKSDYRDMVVRFSHKIYAITSAAREIVDADYLIWLDADVITHKQVTFDDILAWMPVEGDVSYLGRKGWDHSETGFMAFNLKDGFQGRELINHLYRYYTEGWVFLLEKGKTDAHVLDDVLIGVRYTGTNLTKDIEGRDVFDVSPLAGCLLHAKGPKRKEALIGKGASCTNPPLPTDAQELINNKVFDINRMPIATCNNMPMQGICDNIKGNMKRIETWAQYVRPHGEKIVICSAGPSLNPGDIIPWVEGGYKIVAVKHALDRLRSWGITPWGCILLDGRDHAHEFIQSPDKEVIYFVASMVDPKVTDILLKHHCKVVGWHAWTGQEMMEHLPAGHLVVGGGSAATTRGIDLLHDILGFNEMHIYGIDCCYLKEPDLSEAKKNGKMKHCKVTLSVETWGGERSARSFWTEGQLLAQVKEFNEMYFPRKELTIQTYGDGIVPWMQKHKGLFKQWQDREKVKMEGIKATSPNMEDFINGINKYRRKP